MNREFMGNYAGNVSAKRAWEVLSSEKNSFLIDVRTDAEWQFSGVPVLREIGKETAFISWQNYPNFELNPKFFSTIEALGLPHDAKIFFICKLGSRSEAAAEAVTNLGYASAYNIELGMEGAHESSRHGVNTKGWKAENLPWEQA